MGEPTYLLRLHHQIQFKSPSNRRGPSSRWVAVVWFWAWGVLPSWGQLVVSESFTGTAAPNWVLGTESGGYTPQLTAGAGIDTPGDGWLRLTTPGADQSNYAYLNDSFTAANTNISVTFDFTMWGGNGADGISFFLYDADILNTTGFDPGAFGGSLGYANKTTIDGLDGGYLGVGIDKFGNFSNDDEGRNGGLNSNLNPNSIGVRGPDTGAVGGTVGGGWDYLGGTGVNGVPDLDFASRPIAGTGTEFNYYTIRIELDVNDQLSVTFDSDTSDATTIDQLSPLFSLDMSSFARPNELSLGYAASTGGSNNYHELRNLSVVATFAGFLWDNETDDNLWGTGDNWSGNTVPPDQYDVILENTYVNSAQNIELDGDKIVQSLSIDAPFAYTIDPNGGAPGDLIFNNSIADGDMVLNVTEVNGDAAHIINADIVATAGLTNSGLAIDTNTTSSFTVNGGLTLNDNTLTVRGLGDTLINGQITGTAGLVKQDTGTLTLTDNNNSYTGGTTVNLGTLLVDATGTSQNVDLGRVRANRNFLGTEGFTVNNGGILRVNSAASRDINFWSDSGDTFDVNSGGTLSLDSGRNVNIRSGAEVNIDGGLFEAATDNSFIIQGTLDLSNGGTLQGKPGELIAMNDFSLTGTMNLSGGSTAILDPGDDVVFGSASTLTVDNSNLTIDINTGTDPLANANRDVSFSGNATISNNSAVDIDAYRRISFNSGSVTNFNDSTVNIDTRDDVRVLSGSTVNLSNATGGFTAQNGSDSDVTLAGDLNISNGSNFTLTAQDDVQINTPGVLTVDTGSTLNVVTTDDFRVNSGATLVVDGATLDVDANSGADGDVNITGTATIQNSSIATFDTDDDAILGTNGILNVNGSTATFNVGDDFTQNAGSAVNLDNGSVTISGNTAGAVFNGNDTGTITLTNGSDLTIDKDVSNLRGTISIDGTSTLTSSSAQTDLENNTTLNGPGTLEVTGATFQIGTGTSLVSAPNIDIRPGQDSVIQKTSGGTTTFTGAGTITIDNDGFTTTITNDFTSFEANTLDITGGTLLFSADNTINAGTTNLALSGGTLATGGTDQTLAALTLNADSALDLGSGDSIINFSDSSSTTWDENSTLQITNWSGNASGGGTDQVIFGSASGLDDVQLSQIRFVNPDGFAPGIYNARILPSGEIVPVPEPSTIIACIGLIALGLIRERKRIQDLITRLR